MIHSEHHRSHRSGWLRAAVMGANDGIVSTSSLILGVAAANTTQSGIMLAGIAGLVAGAMSMAAGEDVSVSSQSDTSQARPLQAALSSAATFTIGALLPLLVAWWAPPSLLIPLVAVFSLLFLALLGGIAARVGGAPILKAAARVMFWGALAMALTSAIGHVFGVMA